MVKYIKAWDAKKAGKRDARNNFPPPEYDGQEGKYSDFEKEIKNVVEREMDQSIEQWQQRINQILKEVRTMVPDLSNSLKNYKKELESHRKRFGMDVIPEPIHRFGKAAIVILFLLFLFEGGVNIFTFRFLREPGITTVIIGLALAFLIPFSGFYAGRILKARGKRFIEWVVALTFVIAAVALILVVAEGRKIGIKVRNLDPQIVEETFLIFLFMNILFFVIALWDGYASGYTFPALQKSYQELRRRKRQFMNRRARMVDAFVRALRFVQQKEAIANDLSIIYRAANRRARGNIDQNELPKYFKADFKLPIKYPKEIERFIGKDDPIKAYEDELINETSIKQGLEVIENIDKFMEGK